MHPVVAQIALTGHEEFVRLGRDKRLALLLREAEAHDLLVAGERQKDDPPDAELDAIPYQHFIGAR